MKQIYKNKKTFIALIIIIAITILSGMIASLSVTINERMRLAGDDNKFVATCFAITLDFFALVAIFVGWKYLAGGISIAFGYIQFMYFHKFDFTKLDTWESLLFSIMLPAVILFYSVMIHQFQEIADNDVLEQESPERKPRADKGTKRIKQIKI
jgi:hypothetical protein